MPSSYISVLSVVWEDCIDEEVCVKLPILDQSSGPFSRYNIPNLDLYYRDCVIGEQLLRSRDQDF